MADRESPEERREKIEEALNRDYRESQELIRDIDERASWIFGWTTEAIELVTKAQKTQEQTPISTRIERGLDKALEGLNEVKENIEESYPKSASRAKAEKEKSAEK